MHHGTKFCLQRCGEKRRVLLWNLYINGQSVRFLPPFSILLAGMLVTVTSHLPVVCGSFCQLARICYRIEWRLKNYHVSDWSIKNWHFYKPKRTDLGQFHRVNQICWFLCLKYWSVHFSPILLGKMEPSPGSFLRSLTFSVSSETYFLGSMPDV